MYDFETVRPRVGIGSSKWDSALEKGCPPDVVPLTVADMEFQSPPVVREALGRLAEFGMWGYTYEYEAFQQAVAGWLQRRHGWQALPQWMVHTEGIVQALFVAVRALTKPGDGVLVQPPVYYPFYFATQQTGRTLVQNPLRVVNRQYEMDFDDLRQKLKQAKLMLLCSPHNPGGRVWSRQDIETVATLCSEAGVPLYADEIHCDLMMPGSRHFSVGHLPPHLRDNCMIGTSASKTFSLAGLGASTTVVPNEELRQKLKNRLGKDGYAFNTIFGTEATKVAFEAGEDWLEALLAVLHGNYEYLRQALADVLPKAVVWPLQATYLAWVDMAPLGLPQDELMDFLTREAQLFVTDGRKFGDGGEGFVRINLACPKTVLQAAMQRLEKAAKNRGLI